MLVNKLGGGGREGWIPGFAAQQLDNDKQRSKKDKRVLGKTPFVAIFPLNKVYLSASTITLHILINGILTTKQFMLWSLNVERIIMSFHLIIFFLNKLLLLLLLLGTLNNWSNSRNTTINFLKFLPISYWCYIRYI